MNEKRRALGRGLGALIPTTAGDRPVDVFFPRSDTSGPAGDPAEGGAGSSNTGEDHPGNDGRPGDRDGHENSGQGGEGHGVDRDDRHEGDSPAGAAAEPATGGLLPVPGAQFADLPLDSIRPNPRQPRTVFDDDELAELAYSVREIGVLQPVVVRPIPATELEDPDAAGYPDSSGASGADGSPGTAGMPARFELVMGERRWRAARAAGLATVPAIVRTTADEDLLRDALLENLHRSQLNPLEEAAAYRQLLDDFGCSQEELASRIGRSRPQVSNTLRLLRLPPMVQRRVAAGVLSAGHARALLALPDGAAMERLAQRIVAEGLSVRSVEEIVTLGAADAPKARKPRPGARRPQLDDLAARLSDRFDTRVLLTLGQRRGKLVVEFASVEDLNRILAVMGVDQAEDRRSGADPGGPE